MKEAQRFPADFDGIIAGAPGLDWTGRAAQAVRVREGARDRAKRRGCRRRSAQLLHRAVVDACDALDGVKDGLIDDPTRCTFDPASLQCRGAGDAGVPDAGAGGDRAADLLAVDRIRRRGGRSRASRPAASWDGRDSDGRRRRARPASISSASSCSTTRLDRRSGSTSTSDIARAEEADGGTINALDPNLKPFIDRGGKLIQYHGWSDPQISPVNSTQYYARVVEALGGADRRAERLPPVHGARAWATAAAAKARTRSTWSARSSSGSSTARRPIRSSPRTRPTARRSHAAALSVSAGRGLQGHGQHRRGGQLHLSGTVDVIAGLRSRYCRKEGPGHPAFFVRFRFLQFCNPAILQLEVRQSERRRHVSRPPGNSSPWQPRRGSFFDSCACQSPNSERPLPGLRSRSLAEHLRSFVGPMSPGSSAAPSDSRVG